MAILDAQRHHMIRQAVLQRPEAIGEVTVDLWSRLAAQLISIIGEGGFQSLYSRSVHLTRVTFPWIAEVGQAGSAETRFASLQQSLDGRDFAEASEASILLLITLIDILTVLIGELLTSSILSSAWDHDAIDKDGKEFQS